MKDPLFSSKVLDQDKVLNFELVVINPVCAFKTILHLLYCGLNVVSLLA